MRILDRSLALTMVFGGWLSACQEKDLPLGSQPPNAGGSAGLGGAGLGGAGAGLGGVASGGAPTEPNAAGGNTPISGGPGAGGSGAAGASGGTGGSGGQTVLPLPCGELSSGSSETRIRYARAESTSTLTCESETQKRTCDNGTLSAWSGSFTEENCVTLEVCAGNDQRVQADACGLNGHGRLTQNCVDGKWVNTESCADPDVCQNGATRSEACGFTASGTRQWSCNSGQWVSGTCSAPAATQIMADELHSCALLESGELKCWGRNGEIPVPPTDGRYQQAFSQVGKGCGLTADGSLSCWGSLAVSDPPPVGVRFKKIGQSGNCAHGLTVEGAIHRWHCTEVATSPQPGPFSDYSAGLGWYCGVTPEGRAQCFTESTAVKGATSGELGAEGGRYVEAAAGCGLREDGTIVCLSEIHRLPADTYRHLVPIQTDGVVYLCALNRTGHLVCDEGLPFYADLPQGGNIRELSAGRYHACALREGGAVDCTAWYPNFASRIPEGLRFSSITAGGKSLCALNVDGYAQCFGPAAAYQPPVQPLKQVAVGKAGVCGLSVAGQLSCWTGSEYLSPPEPYQSAHFSEIAVGARHFGGILSDSDHVGEVLMWNPSSTTGPQALPFQLLVAKAPYQKLALGGDGYCAEGNDGQTGCYAVGYGPFYFLGTGTVSRAAVVDQSTACALDPEGRTVCVGSNGAPFPHETFQQLVMADQAASTFCGLHADQSLLCLGDLGTRLVGAENTLFKEIALGEDFLCGLTPDGALRCQGIYDFGQHRVALP